MSDNYVVGWEAMWKLNQMTCDVSACFPNVYRSVGS